MLYPFREKLKSRPVVDGLSQFTQAFFQLRQSVKTREIREFADV